MTTKPEVNVTGELLDMVGRLFDEYVIFPSPEARTAVTLWAAHTWVASHFESTPRLAMLSAEPGSGKAHPAGTGILTPTGYRAVETLRAGDLVIGSDGKPTRVMAKRDWGVMESFEIRFGDGSSVRAAANHLWSARTHSDKQRKSDWRTVSTSELSSTLDRRWEIPTVSAPIEFPERELPIDPYVLGALLGDGYLRAGTVAISTDGATAAEMARRLPAGYGVNTNDGGRGHSWSVSRADKKSIKGRGDTRSPNSVADALSSLGLTGKTAAYKFIPDAYLYAGAAQRLDLLRGLMDTDGELSFSNGSGRTAFSSASEKLRDQVAFLVESFGGVARKGFKAAPTYTYRGEKRTGLPSYRLNIHMDVNPFLTRPGWASYAKHRPMRSVRSVTPVGSEPMTCIQVEAADGLYLTERCIVTHNSRVLEVLAEITPNSTQAINLKPATMWRLIEHASPHPTLFVDEADTIFGRVGSGSAHVELRAILNAGYRRGAMVPRCVGNQDIKLFRTFAPVALGGLGVLPETLMTRSVVIRMKKAGPTQSVKPFRLRFAAGELANIKSRLAAWSLAFGPQLELAFPEMPVKDRAADVWEPLYAVAELAGPEWRELCDRACRKLTANESHTAPSAGQALLRDIREVFRKRGSAQLFTKDILTSLYALDSDVRWPETSFNSQALARVLSEYEVKPVQLRDGATTGRGYRISSFADAWERYVPERKEAQDA